MLTLLNILTNKYTYIIAFLISIIITIAVLLFRIESYKNKNESLYIEIENLKITNTLLYKENIFKQEQIRLIESFTNSKKQIEKIKIKELDYEEKNTIISINSDFYNFMQNNKASTNTSYNSTPSILSKEYN